MPTTKIALKPSQRVVMLIATPLTIVLLVLAGRAAAVRLWPDVPEFGPPPSPPKIASPEVRPDHTIIFRLFAPKATEVMVSLDENDEMDAPLTKDEAGVWTATVGPLEPNVYRYMFHVDGMTMLDPHNAWVKPGRSFVENLVEVAGDRAQDLRPVPHGALHVLHYESKALDGKTRGLVVYTPPDYGTALLRHYPVLYLLHGTGDDEHCWTDVGLANRILDNQIADGQTVPMIVVMPDGHALDLLPEVDPGDNTKILEADLFGDVIPLVERTYRVKPGPENRAVAGLSMGGGHALDLGTSHSEMFSFVGLFSMGRAETAAMVAPLDAATLNRRLQLFWIGCGRQDVLHEYSVNLCEQLTNKGIHHEWHESDGGHTWITWRHNLTSFAPRLFRD